jgi:hypothetical protein
MRNGLRTMSLKLEKLAKKLAIADKQKAKKKKPNASKKKRRTGG